MGFTVLTYSSMHRNAAVTQICQAHGTDWIQATLSLVYIVGGNTFFVHKLLVIN